MARTLKGTRARGLPPKLLLSRKQDATGSYPTIWRTASDNRTGKYPVFFNDNKVITFNQPVTTNIGLSVSTYPEYEEQVVTVGSPGNPVNSVAVNYSYPFSGVPMVVLTEITPNAGTPTVNAFLIGSTVNGNLIGFSAPFEGTVVYRAVFLSSPGQPVNVVRSPRFTNQYSLVVNQGAVLTAENNAFLTFSDFGSAPPENYVTFFDFYANNQADISSSVTYVTNTSVQVTASATATNVLYYMGVGTSTASIDVTGIVYPLVMTPEAINAGLSQQDKTDLYKQPYFSGSVIANQPIITSGSMKKGVSDLFVTFTPGQDIEPFIDYENPEVDAKLTNNSFFATGSAVTTTGLGFQQPLWSKNKLEIDLDVSTPVTFGQSTYNNQDKLMAYYDFSQKTYVPIGDPRANNSSTNQLITTSVGGVSEYFSSKSIGFSQSVRGVYNNSFEALMGKTFAAPINSFGFPYDHKRYGIGNGGVTNNTNMLLPLNDLISEPFLLEKIVLEFTGAMSSSGTDDSGISAISTFFILNQSATNFFQTSSTNQYLTSYFNYSATPPHKGATFFGFTSPTLYVTQSNYNIDLVTYAQISALTSSVQNNNLLTSLYERDLNIYQEAVTPVQNSYGLNPNFGYSGSFILSASVRNSLNFEGTALFKNYARVPPAFDFTGYTLLANKGGRKNLTQPCGRNWKTLLPANAPPTVISIPPPPVTSQLLFIYYEQTEQTNPYILLPTDKLIIGWQAPFGNISGSIVGNCGDISQMHFPAGKGKLILYGSTLKLNPETNQLEEHHDTLNQLLSSNSIHEVIGE